MAYSIKTLATVSKMANKAVRDAKTLHSLLVEAGEFQPNLLVNSLVQHRSLEIEGAMKERHESMRPALTAPLACDPCETRFGEQWHDDEPDEIN